MITEQIKVSELVRPVWQHKDFCLMERDGAYYCIVRWSRSVSAETVYAKVRKAMRLCGLVGKLVDPDMVAIDPYRVSSQQWMFMPYGKLSYCIYIEVSLDTFDCAKLDGTVVYSREGVR